MSILQSVMLECNSRMRMAGHYVSSELMSNPHSFSSSLQMKRCVRVEIATQSVRSPNDWSHVEPPESSSRESSTLPRWLRMQPATTRRDVCATFIRAVWFFLLGDREIGIVGRKHVRTMLGARASEKSEILGTRRLLSFRSPYLNEA